MPGIVIPRDPNPDEVKGLVNHVSKEVLEDFISSGSGFIESVLDPEKMGILVDGEFKLDDYQREMLDTTTNFICNKARQLGGSFGLSLKAFERAITAMKNYRYIFTSYKKEEAINKVDYVKSFLDALPPTFRKKIQRDPLQLIEFVNNNGTRSTIMSHAQKPIRGINGDIGLDELAFYQFADDVFDSALPATGAVNGTIDIISTPFGKAGKFYDIFTGAGNYKDFHRIQIFWWYCPRYLKDGSTHGLIDAYHKAPRMTTEERVRTFGNIAINQMFDNSSDVETFQQEYEGLFVDEQAAFFSRDLIIASMYNDIELYDDFQPQEDDFIKGANIEESLKSRQTMVQKRYEGVTDVYNSNIQFKKYKTLDELYLAVAQGQVSRRLFGGYDVGTTRDSTHFVILEEVLLKDGTTLQIERFSLNRHDWELSDQEQYIRQVLSQGVITKIAQDATGIGMQMAQKLSKEFPSNFLAMQMGGNNKKQEALMVNMKLRFESGTIAFKYDKLMLDSFYSIQRVVSASMSISYQADNKKRHHADAAWAASYASMLGTEATKKSVDASGVITSLNMQQMPFHQDIDTSSIIPVLSSNQRIAFPSRAQSSSKGNFIKNFRR